MRGLRDATAGLVLGLAAALTVADGRAADPPEASAITPDLERCTLEVGGRSLKPTGPPSADPAGYRAGRLRVVVGADDVRAFADGVAAPKWTAKAPAGTRLSWLAADDATAYLAGYRADRDARPEAPARVRRLDLATGRWRDDLPGGGPAEPKRVEWVAGVLAADGRVTALVQAATEDDGNHKPAGYRVVSFPAGEVKPVWEKAFKSAGSLPSPGVFLLSAARAPDKADPDVRPLSRLGKDVLVCAGPVDDLVCVAGDTGEARWRVPRVWEYERGFIGPSVWQHFLGRGGKDDLFGGKDDKPVPAAGRLQYIVGGPVVVDGAAGGDKPHVFVAVAKGPARFTDYLAECVVYELSADGRPLGVVTLPRMVRGGRAVAQAGGVVWACQGGGFVRLAPGDDRDLGLGMGPGGPDYLSDVEWYRGLRPARPAAWLTADSAGDPVAFGPGWAARVRSGGYVPAADAGEYRFPLALVELATGAARDLELRVPFAGKVPEPQTNFSRTTGRDGKVHWEARGPYLLGVTGLAADGDRLRVTLGMRDWARSVEFEIPKPAPPPSK